jgi:hypothetical protein
MNLLKKHELQDRTYRIYKNSPKTDDKSYKKAQQALKYDQEQTFSDEEIDKMLSALLRKGVKYSNIEDN